MSSPVRARRITARAGRTGAAPGPSRPGSGRTGPAGGGTHSPMAASVMGGSSWAVGRDDGRPAHRPQPRHGRIMEAGKKKGTGRPPFRAASQPLDQVGAQRALLRKPAFLVAVGGGLREKNSFGKAVEGPDVALASQPGNAGCATPRRIDSRRPGTRCARSGSPGRRWWKTVTRRPWRRSRSATLRARVSAPPITSLP